MMGIIYRVNKHGPDGSDKTIRAILNDYYTARGRKGWKDSAALTNRSCLDTYDRCVEGACRQGDTKFREGDCSGVKRNGPGVKR
jgi:hypothetical protein